MPAQPTSSDRTAVMFEFLDETSLPSAEAVVPLLLELLAPSSAMDLGCGLGSWLAVLRRSGVTDVLGIDGDYVDRSKLLIPPTCFRPHDLGRPLDLGRTFDVALCLEVGEHLEASRAPAIVDTLTAAAPAVVFSAAIPGQGGVGHVNEQWPDYWAGLFAARGYECLDVLRPAFWDDPQVAYWYRQNMFLYATPEVAATVRQRSPHPPADWPAHLVHPDAFARATRRGELSNHSVVALAKAVPGAIRRAVTSRR